MPTVQIQTILELHGATRAATRRGDSGARSRATRCFVDSENDLGYALYSSVVKTKIALSSADEAPSVFSNDPVHIETSVRRRDFEGWIERELTAIEASVDGLLADTQTPADQVDRVFMTGGSAFVPAVRRILTRRFGADRVRGGDELVSVASGLALRARDLAQDQPL
jgi:hypothetical chaperone protein